MVASCTIYLDSSFDLYAAGYKNDYQSCLDFENAYRSAANYIGEKIGIEIRVATQGPFTKAESDGFAEENELWQKIHDVVYFDDDDGEWDFDEGRADKLADKLAIIME